MYTSKYGELKKGWIHYSLLRGRRTIPVSRDMAEACTYILTFIKSKAGRNALCVY